MTDDRSAGTATLGLPREENPMSKGHGWPVNIDNE
jgi:hypothetical protein